MVNDYLLDARTSVVKFDVALADDGICRYYLLGLILSIIINYLLLIV